MRCAKQLQGEVPELDVELMPLVRDQINDLAGVEAPVEVKIFGPDSGGCAAWPAKWERSSKNAGDDKKSTRTCYLGNPTSSSGPTASQTARVGVTEQDVETQLNAALYGQVAGTFPSRTA